MKDSNFLTKQEKELLEEILRVAKILKKGELALTGSQYRLFSKAKIKAEYKDQYETRLSKMNLFSTEERKRHKKKDTADMFL